MLLVLRAKEAQSGTERRREKMSSDGAASKLAKVQSFGDAVGADCEGDNRGSKRNRYEHDEVGADRESKRNRYDHDEGINQYKDQNSAGSLPWDIVACILARLPARSVARFRCVCKKWRSLTCDNGFIDEHSRLGGLERRNLVTALWFGKHRLDLCKAGANYDEIKPSSSCIEVELDGEESIPDSFSYGVMSNPVNGLVAAFCIPKASHKYYHPCLINPLTREGLQLPGGGFQVFGKCPRSPPGLGLGFDASSGAYKLVTFESGDDNKSRECKVLTVGAGGWRCVDRHAPCAIGMGSFFLDGAIYWLGRTGAPVLAFDVKEERIRFIPMPEIQLGVGDDTFMYLRELEGHVCFVQCIKDSEGSSTRIWRLVGHPNHECWKLEHEINTPHEKHRNKPWVLDIRGGKAILHTSDAICSYDLRNRAFHRLFHCLQYWVVVTESLVSPRSLYSNCDE